MKLNTTSLWSSKKVIQLTKQEQLLPFSLILIILIHFIQIRQRVSLLVLILEDLWPLTTNSTQTSNKTWTAKQTLGSWTHLKWHKVLLQSVHNSHSAKSTLALPQQALSFQSSHQLPQWQQAKKFQILLLSSLSSTACIRQEIPKCSLIWFSRILGF